MKIAVTILLLGLAGSASSLIGTGDPSGGADDKLESIGDEMNKTVEEVVDDMDLDNGLKECFLTGIKTGVWTDFITKHEDNPQTGLPVVMKAALNLARPMVPMKITDKIRIVVHLKFFRDP
ncbi:uncharacterized protein O3C94_003436 [Discoglossus pictus]